MGSTLRSLLIGASTMLMLGMVHAWQAPPQRIISLLPSATEMVCALGACDRLVGVDEFSLDPPQVRALPRLGKTWQPDIERILTLRPDMVLVGQVGGVIGRLQAARIPYMVADATTMEQVHTMLGKLDALLQTKQSAQLWRRMQQQVDATARQLKTHGSGPRVYLEIDPAMYTAGPHSFMGQLLGRLGARNIAPSGGAHFMRLSPEFVLHADPDLLILAYPQNSLQTLEERPGWQHMRALQPDQRARRVCQLTEEESRTVTRPGPRLDQAASIYAACILRLNAPSTP